MKISSDDVKGFVLGVIASITAVIIWDLYKKKKKWFDYADREIVEEIKTEIKKIKGNDV